MVTGHRARFTIGTDNLYLGIYTGEIVLHQILALPHHLRTSIALHGPYIDVFLGETRVYKRTSKALLFASCPDIARFLEPLNGRFVLRLPHGLVPVVAVKLAVLYMEQCLVTPQMLGIPWEVRGEVVDYICLSQLLAFIGMSTAAQKMHAAIQTRLRERSLRFEQIQSIWNWEKVAQPSKYSKALAENILNHRCVPLIELFDPRSDIGLTVTYQKHVQRRMYEIAHTIPRTIR
jgi:hypothetical protein